MKFKIDLEKLNDGVWFGDEPGSKVCLRLAPEGVIVEMRKKYTKPSKKAVLNPLTKSMEMVPDDTFDMDGFSKALYCYSIQEWDLLDVKETAIPCTDENKIALRGCAEFSKFYFESMKELRKLKGFENEDLEKNLGNSQDGS